MNFSPESLRPPWRNLPLELRAVLDVQRPPDLANFTSWPRGQGRAIMIVPGFGQSGGTTATLRDALKRSGFTVYDWGQGRNQGLKSGMTAKLLVRIGEITRQHGGNVALVGWSLGGVIARELARKTPSQINRVITLGSPIAGPQATTIQAIFSLLNRKSNRKDGFSAKRYAPPPVPCTAIYTRQDGIVNWQASMEPAAPNTENIEVNGSHLGLGYNPWVWHIICHRCSPETFELPYHT